MRRLVEILLIVILLLVLINVGRFKFGVWLYNKGCQYYDNAKYEEAIIHFKRSLKIHPKADFICYSLANTYLEKRMEEEAIKEFKETLRLNPSYLGAYQRLKHIYCSRQEYESCLNLLNQAQKILPNNFEIKKLIDEVLLEYAADYLDKAIDLFLVGNKSKAYELLNKALGIKPDFTFVRYTLAYLYFTEYNYPEAEVELNRVIQIDSKFWSAYKLLGDIYFRKGLYQEAIDKYRLAISLNHNDAILCNDLGLALVQLELYDEAIVYLEKALKLEPKNLNIRYNLASTYRDKGRFDEAISEYKKIIDCQQDYPNIHNDLGDIYQNLGRKEEAFREYSKEIEYCKAKLSDKVEDVIILNNLAYALCGIGEYTRAKDTVKRAITLKPKYRQAYLTLAKICEKQGKADGAIIALNKAKQLSTQTHFIDRDIARLKKELLSDHTFFTDTIIYLKNGRKIQGRLKKEDEEKITLEVKLGNVIGSLTFLRDTIEQIIRSDQVQ